MCQSAKVTSPAPSLVDAETKKETSRFAIPPLLLVALIPLAPPYFFLNRGYTQWWHWCCLFSYLIGEPDFWKRFLVLQGIGVNLGWYSAVVDDYFTNGRLCHLLYNNMPPGMRAVMLTDGKLASGGIVSDNPQAVALLVASHIIDFIAHPLMLYVVWKRFTSRGGSFQHLVSSWDVWWGTLFLSRIYSMVHEYYNDGQVTGLFYYGHDVYNIDNLESYTVAYIGEGSIHGFFVLYRMYLNCCSPERQNRPTTDCSKDSKNYGEDSPKIENLQRPSLIQSESSFSACSAAMVIGEQ